MIVAAVLAVFGVAAGWLGVWAWRNAERLVDSARQQLVELFGEQFPGLEHSEPDPRGARIAAVGFTLVGVVLLGLAMLAATGGMG